MNTRPPPPNPHDRFFRRIWSRKRVARDFLRYYLPPELVALLDLDPLKLAKGSFVDRRLRGHYSDLLYEVRLKDGSRAFVYLLLEHKKIPERFTAFQLLRYLVRIWERATETDPGHFPPIIPVVVYHGQQPWPYGRSLHAAFRPSEALARYAPQFHFELCDLSGLDETQIRGEVLLRVALLLMKHIADADLDQRLPGIFGLLRGLHERPTALGYLETLLRYLAMAADQLSENSIRSALRGALPPTEEAKMATLAQRWFEDGRAKGRDEGRDEGRAEGVLTGEQRMLVRLMELRFGALSESDRQRITAADADTLLVWSERVLTARSPQEVFGD